MVETAGMVETRPMLERLAVAEAVARVVDWFIWFMDHWQIPEQLPQMGAL
jgi:hypothetical protein